MHTSNKIDNKINESHKSILFMTTSLSETNRNYWQEYDLNSYANLA